MEIQKEDMSIGELGYLRKKLQAKYRSLGKIAAFLFTVAIVILFVPLSTFGLGAKQTLHTEGALIDDIGDLYAFLFFILPILILLGILYRYWIMLLKKDLEEELKEIGLLEVEKIEKLEDDIIKTFQGALTHRLIFTANDMKIKEHMFSFFNQPELLHAKQMKVEQTQHTKLVLRWIMVD